jgi:hypothetical protein
MMARRKRTVGLIAFLRGSTSPENKMPGCCNYDHDSGGCLDKDCCLVEQGKRCGYFEKVVLPTSVDLGLKELVYSLYQKHVGIAEDDPLINTANIRPCPDCGAELKPRQRYCDDCKRRRRRKSYRNSRSKRNS